MEEIAEVYSRALFEVAKEQGVLDRVHDELGQFADALGDSRDLQVFFFSPYFSSQEKKDGIGTLVQDADPNFVRFLELLAERHRMPVVFRMRDELDRLWRRENKLLPVSVTSAVELDSELVFVGDGGGTEPSDKSRRYGVEWANFYKPTERLALDLDISLSEARLLEVDSDADRVPGALLG